MLRPAAGLNSYRALVAATEGTPWHLDPTSTPAQRAARYRANAAMHCIWARQDMKRAYNAVRRYPTCPRWGRMDWNPEARTDLAKVRSNLKLARAALRDADALDTLAPALAA